MNEELFIKAQQWGVDKGLTGPNGIGTIQAQFIKFLEEMKELFDALKEGNREKVRDALGDLQVVAIQAYSMTSGFHRVPTCAVAECDVKAWYKDPTDFAGHAISHLKVHPDFAIGLIRELAKFLGHDPDECLQEAYDEIKDRTGQIIGNDFVKNTHAAVAGILDPKRDPDDDFADVVLDPKNACRIDNPGCESCQ